jgi:hypothetical protein
MAVLSSRGIGSVPLALGVVSDEPVCCGDQTDAMVRDERVVSDESIGQLLVEEPWLGEEQRREVVDELLVEGAVAAFAMDVLLRLPARTG